MIMFGQKTFPDPQQEEQIEADENEEDNILWSLLPIAYAWIPAIYDKAGFCYVVNRRTGQVIIKTSPD